MGVGATPERAPFAQGLRATFDQQAWVFVPVPGWLEQAHPGNLRKSPSAPGDDGLRPAGHNALCVVTPRSDRGDRISALDGLTSAASAGHRRPGPCLSEGGGVAFHSRPFSAPAPGALALPAGFESGSEPRGFSQGDLHGTHQLPACRAWQSRLPAMQRREITWGNLAQSE